MSLAKTYRSVQAAWQAPIIDPGTHVYCPWCKREEKVLVTRRGLVRHLDAKNAFVCDGSGQWVTYDSGCRVIKFEDW